MRFHKALIAVCALVALAATPAPRLGASYDGKLIDLDRRYTMWSLRESPTSSTDAGVHDVDDKLADFSVRTQPVQFAQLLGAAAALAADIVPGVQQF